MQKDMMGSRTLDVFQEETKTEFVRYRMTVSFHVMSLAFTLIEALPMTFLYKNAQ
jgi:hypothetical protein